MENGKKLRNFFTAKNLWQQDITFKERTKAGMKTAGMIGITAWLYYRRVWAVIFLILPGIWLYREFLEEESKKKEQEFQKQFREMIQTLSSALNTGHDGSLSTGHANSPKDMISRLETMVLMGMDLPLPAIERQIASGLDIIVHLGRLRDKSRKVLEVTEVLGYWDGQIHLQTIYRYEEIRKEDENVTENEKKDQENKVHGEWKKVAELFHREKLVAAGYYI